MATRIKTEGKHVILQNTVTSKEIFGLGKIEVGFRNNTAQDKVFFVKAGTETRIGGNIDYAYTEILNGDNGDAAFASMVALKTYLRTNTGGFNTALGSSGAESEVDLQAHSIGGTVQTATGDGTTTIDWKLGNMFDFQFGAFNETFTFTPPTKPGTFILKLVQDSGGSRTVTWPGTVKWPGGTAPTLTTTLTTGTDIITFYWNGTTYSAVSTLDLS